MGNFLNESTCCKYIRKHQLELLDNNAITSEKSIDIIRKLQAVYRGYIFRKKQSIKNKYNQDNKGSKIFDMSKIQGKLLSDNYESYNANSNNKIRELNNKLAPFELNEKEVCLLKTGFLRKFTIQYPDNSVYKGYYNKDWQKEGYGILNLADGGLYEGFFKANLMEGRGRLINPEGFVYDGEFLNNKANGFGKYISLDGVTYKGQWKDEKQHGYGEEIFADGSHYEGDYFMGKKNGKGRFKWPDGFQYDGEFFNNDIHGFGTYRWKDGRIYQGQWSLNKMNGCGIFIWPDKKKYIGCYKNDVKEGIGIFYWPDGRKYEGCWWNGKQHGCGIFTNPTDGTKYGNWESGKKMRTYETTDDISKVLNEIRKKKIECKFDDMEKLMLNFEKS
jgi:hypothetical protein